jgi:CubicO group peptidase (beta-lactamase class C family)
MQPLKVLAAVAIVAIAGAAATFVQRSAGPIRTGTASVSHSLCAAAFISRIDPDLVYAQEQRPEGGMSLLDWALHYNVDRGRREVRTTVLGGFAGRAVYRDSMGCLVIQEDGASSTNEALVAPPAPATPTATLPEPAAAAHEPPVSTPSATSKPAFEKALDQAFAEPDPSHMRWTKAVVAMHDGRIIAERYAPGYGPDTRIWGHSLSKSVTNALVAILVRKGALRTDQTVPDWRSAADSRRSVTINQLLRMTTGLPFDETGAPNDPTTHMLFRERDMAAYAEHTPLAYEQTGYGAGFWTNLVNAGSVPVWDAPWGMPKVPKDMFYARGYLGQFVVIVPSERLVVARLGLTHDGGTGTGTLVADIIAALHAAPTASR